MVSREHKAALCEKLQLLRSVTHSHAQTDNSIIKDASKYIEELKGKVERLNQDISIASQPSTTVPDIPLPMVTVETLEKGFLINAYSEKSCTGLLVTVLEACEELGLNVLEARVSCTDRFQLQAVGGENEEEEEGEGNIDARAVKRTVLRAIKIWTASADDE